MFRNLGENFVICYFRDEYVEISDLMQSDGIGKQAASRDVLGVNYARLDRSPFRSGRH